VELTLGYWISFSGATPINFTPAKHITKCDYYEGYKINSGCGSYDHL